MEAVWDTESENFLGRDWDWPDGKRPLPVTISFFRPQDEEQLVALNQGGHQAMVDGTKRGFEVIRDLIERGEAVPAVDRIDYLQLNRVIPMVCGTGFNYTAASPRGVAPCHELLFGHEPNMDAVRDGRNLMDLANQPYAGQRKQLIGPNIANPGVDKTMALILALHGGTGCPITARLENGGNLGTAASTARELYPPLIPEMLALEAMRQNARQRQVAALN
jgi:hypothetical protein